MIFLELGVCVGLMMSSMPASAAGDFDGTWQVAVDCASSPDGAKGYRWVFPATVRNGQFIGLYKEPNSVPSGRLSGRIGPDGSALLTMTGRTGDPAYAINRVAGGSPIRYSITARFSGNSGSGTRNEQRSCSAVFTRT
ncbi:MAG: hypothetical protein JOY97_02050 [Hyphomicrobiales bacterium]|nr:hypothetical protein [Hyphomicrobiales bacterium]